MKIRSVARPIKYAPGLKKIDAGLPRDIGHPRIVKQPRGPRTGDIAHDPLEEQAWPKGQRFMGKLASLPERRVIWWLLNVAKLTPGQDFDFQPDFLGGRMLSGGIVADMAMFTILPGSTVIWEVQGTTWHRNNWKQHKDEARRQVLLTFPEVDAVINLWESDINRSDSARNDACYDAMRLIERTA